MWLSSVHRTRPVLDTVWHVSLATISGQVMGTSLWLLVDRLTGGLLTLAVDTVTSIAPAFAGSPWIHLIPAGAVIRAVHIHRNKNQETPMTKIRNRIHRSTHLLAAGTALGLMMALGVTAGAGSASAAAGNPVTTQVKKADAAFAKAVQHIQAKKYGAARDDLAAVRSHTAKANVAAKALIGAPPTDPESDDLPGPPAVLAATKLDTRISTGTVALFNQQTNAKLVHSLRLTIQTAQVKRDSVLDPVIALPAEGEGGDYADGMADNLAMYSREVTAIQNALATFTLTQPATDGLTNSLARAQATKAKVTKAFGGGERSTRPAA